LDVIDHSSTDFTKPNTISVLRISLALIIVLNSLLISCDCFQHQEGIIIDSQSNESIGGVEVYKETRPEQKYHSNSCGFYEWRGISGGLSPKCPEPKLYFVHSMYDTLFNPSNLNVVRMRKK
jgi:hypothetical protein